MFGKVNKRNNYNSINILVIADCHHLKEEYRFTIDMSQ